MDSAFEKLGETVESSDGRSEKVRTLRSSRPLFVGKHVVFTAASRAVGFNAGIAAVEKRPCGNTITGSNATPVCFRWDTILFMAKPALAEDRWVLRFEFLVGVVTSVNADRETRSIGEKQCRIRRRYASNSRE